MASQVANEMTIAVKLLGQEFRKREDDQQSTGEPSADFFYGIILLRG